MFLDYSLSDIPKRYKVIFVDFLTFLWVFEIIHIFLRFYVLVRPTIYGNPLVSKFEWYFFHAIAIDFTWIFILSGSVFSLSIFVPKYYSKIKTQIFVLHIILIGLTLLDHETMRHLNWHFSMNLFTTYNNGSAFHQVFVNFLNEEPFPFSFIPAIVVVVVFLFKLPKWIKVFIESRLQNVLLFSIIFLIICWTYRNVIWKGGFRENRLKPVINLLYEELFNSNFHTNMLSFENGTKYFQQKWLATNNDSLWVFNDSLYPFIRTPIHDVCQTESFPYCNNDADKDGYSLKQDCHDWDSTIHPGSFDIPSNGIDEDCNGIDDKPWNIAIFFLESHRAMNVGFLKPYGATVDGTPFLNHLAKQPETHIWSRFSLSGTPTIGALMATHLGIWNHPSKHVSTAFNQLKNHTFVNILREKGYQTNFFSSPDPAWDNQIPWLQAWYGRYIYDRNREHDRDMYKHLGSWMLDSLKEDKPFLITSITKVNHFPFNAVEGIEPHKSNDSHLDRMLKTMTYTENSLSTLFSTIKKEPWFKKTIFIFLADHGFFLGERGFGGPYGGLYPQLTWIPFVIFGDHPQLKKSHYSFPASQIDIAPTILDLVGIRTKVHHVGQSLVKPSNSKHSFLFINERGSFEQDSLKFHCNKKLNSENEIYNTITDPLELNNIYLPKMIQKYKNTCQTVFTLDSLVISVYEQNRIWKK